MADSSNSRNYDPPRACATAPDGLAHGLGDPRGPRATRDDVAARVEASGHVQRRYNRGRNSAGPDRTGDRRRRWRHNIGSLALGAPPKTRGRDLDARSELEHDRHRDHAAPPAGRFGCSRIARLIYVATTVRVPTGVGHFCAAAIHSDSRNSQQRVSPRTPLGEATAIDLSNSRTRSPGDTAESGTLGRRRRHSGASCANFGVRT